jgi:hydroxymethylbilane synthase
MDGPDCHSRWIVRFGRALTKAGRYPRHAPRDMMVPMNQRSTTQPIKLGTRGSLLARTQSQLVADSLKPFLNGRAIELEIITTTGDQQQDRPLTDAGGKGLFIKELEDALLDGRIDFAVHSAKDMPVDMPPGLAIVATPRREVPNDVWIGHNGQRIADLPPGATVGTTSLRRQAQLLGRRPDVKTAVFRGNIDTRLRKVQEGQVAGTFLAAAGLHRTGLLPPQAVVLPTDEFIPAAGQGILALQCRAFDVEICQLLAQLNDPDAQRALTFERKVVQALAGSCLAPIGVCVQRRTAAFQSDRPGDVLPDPADLPGWIVRAFVATPDGKSAARSTLLTTESDPICLYAPLLQALESRGSKEILAQLKLH